MPHLLLDVQVDWFAPIVADAEAGFGGPLNCFELMKSMIKAGAAGVHFEDQLSSEKKCGHLGGKASHCGRLAPICSAVVLLSCIPGLLLQRQMTYSCWWRMLCLPLPSSSHPAHDAHMQTFALLTNVMCSF